MELGRLFFSLSQHVGEGGEPGDESRSGTSSSDL